MSTHHHRRATCIAWNCRAEKSSGEINSSSAVVGQRVFFGSDDGNIYGLRTSDGKEVWKYNAGRKITAGVAIGEGHLVVGEDGASGNILCFGVEKS